MLTKILIIAVIKKGDEILLRKKPDGSPPYKETWYIFGAELMPGEKVEKTLQDHVRKQTGIEITLQQEVGWDTEVKTDLDGVEKQFVYLDAICRYESGELRLSDGIEKLEWVAIQRLADYDNVPPSKKLFLKLGYTTED